MNRRLLVVCLALAALFGSAAPAGASVASFGVGVLSPTCSHSGAKHGFGKMSATAHFQESGGTGTNYFSSIATVQKLSGTAWVKYSPRSTNTSTRFAATTVGHFVNIGWKYSFTAADAGHTYRLYFVYQFWHSRSGPDQLLFTSTRATPAC